MKGLSRPTPTKNFLRWRGRGFEVWASCPSCSENQTCPGRSTHPTTLQAAPPAFSNLPGPSRGPSPPTPRFGTVHRAGSGVVIKSVQVLVKQLRSKVERNERSTNNRKARDKARAIGSMCIRTLAWVRQGQEMMINLKHPPEV